MWTNNTIRIKMLEVVKTALEDAAADQTIVFKDSADVILAEMLFKELNRFGSEIKFIFKGLDDTTTLKAVVLANGTVAKFEIEGKIPDDGTEIALRGTVGSLNSNADLRFNRREWATGGNIIFNKLTISLKQGT